MPVRVTSHPVSFLETVNSTPQQLAVSHHEVAVFLEPLDRQAQTRFLRGAPLFEDAHHRPAFHK